MLPSSQVLPRTAWLVCLTALTAGVSTARANPDAEVASAADPGSPIDLHVRLDYEYQIDVENLVGCSVKLSVRDLVPISTDERIKVELGEQTTPPSASLPEDNKGVLRWELNLAPGEKRELKLSYSVRYPQTLPVTGVE